MDKEVVKKLLTNSQLTQQELFKFIVDYVKWKKNLDINQEQLQGIIHLLQMGVFTLKEATKEAADHFGLQLVSLVGPQGNLLKAEVYEKEIYNKSGH